MGACNCNAKNIIEEASNQILAKEENQPEAESQKQIIIAQNVEKKRPKNALIVENSALEIDDNVIFNEGEEVSASDIVEIKKSLQKHFIFSQLNEKEIDIFLKQMRPCTAKSHTYIFKQGDKSGSYYIILEGTCQIEINNEKKRTLTFGNSFGDLGIIYNAPRSASVYTLSDVFLVQIGRKVFKKVMDDINVIYEKENKRFLEVLTFFKDLTEEQKNAIASTCLTETYEEGQVIFNQGDDANSFYIIKEGVVIIKQKNHELKEMNCFGQNCILVEGGVRSNTLLAKTKCILISMSRENIKNSLGDNIKNILKKNMIWKIIEESNLYKDNKNFKWREAADSYEEIVFKKSQIVFQKDQSFKGVIFILFNSKLKGPTATFLENAIIAEKQLNKLQILKIPEDLTASDDGFLIKITIQFEEVIQALEPLSIQTKKPNKSQFEEATINVRDDKTSLEKKMVITDFHVVRRLREGNFGKVYCCWNQKTGKLYAIKVLDRSYVEKAQIIQYIMSEEQILRTVPKHPLIVGYHKLIKDTTFIYLIMEFIEGEDLFDVITKSMGFTLENTKFIVAQILIILEHLHSNRIIYRDLKPENLMMGISGYLTLVDMGTAKRLKIQKRYRTTTIIGTPHYMAPEIITGKGYSFPVDLWSLGVIAYQLLCAKLPFGESSDDPFTIYQEIINSSVKYPRNCAKSCKAFIEKLLSRSPQHRMGNGFQEMKKHVFFEGQSWKKLLNKEIPSFYQPSQELKIKSSEIERALGKQKNKVPNRFLNDRIAK